MRPEQKFRVRGTGFQSDSSVELFLVHDATTSVSLGTAATSTKGDFAVVQVLPDNTPTGDAEIRAVGTAPDGSSLALTAEIDVKPPQGK